MNLNKGCIEIVDVTFNDNMDYMMNLNKGCIEIYRMECKIPQANIDEP